MAPRNLAGADLLGANAKKPPRLKDGLLLLSFHRLGSTLIRYLATSVCPVCCQNPAEFRYTTLPEDYIVRGMLLSIAEVEWRMGLAASTPHLYDTASLCIVAIAEVNEWRNPRKTRIV